MSCALHCWCSARLGILALVSPCDKLDPTLICFGTGLHTRCKRTRRPRHGNLILTLPVLYSLSAPHIDLSDLPIFPFLKFDTPPVWCQGPSLSPKPTVVPFGFWAPQGTRSSRGVRTDACAVDLAHPAHYAPSVPLTLIFVPSFPASPSSN